MPDKLARLQRNIDYQFNHIKYLTLALTHRSASSNHNERLEFLGDSVLGLVISTYLFNRFAQAKEGELSRLRSSLVRKKTLAIIAKQLDLGEYLKLGSGELKSGGFRRESTLADSLEALLGAIYLDGGMEACQTCILNWFESLLNELTLESSGKDSKTLVQEWLQSRHLELPNYHVTAITGNAHNQAFEVSLTIKAKDIKTIGKGTSRRKAEQQAARAALKLLQDNRKRA